MEDARHLSPSAQEAVRLRAVAALAAGRDRGDVAARNQAELAAEMRRFCRRCQRQPHIVRGYLGGPPVRCTFVQNPLSF